MCGANNIDYCEVDVWLLQIYSIKSGKLSKVRIKSDSNSGIFGNLAAKGLINSQSREHSKTYCSFGSHQNLSLIQNFVKYV